MKRRQILTYLCFVGLLAIWLIGFLTLNVDAEPPRPEHTKATMPEITLDELEAAENELIESALLARSTKLDHHLLLLRGTAPHLRDRLRHHCQRTARDSVCELCCRPCRDFARQHHHDRAQWRNVVSAGGRYRPYYPGKQAGHCGTRSPGGFIFGRENG